MASRIILDVTLTLVDRIQGINKADEVEEDKAKD